MSTAHEKPIRLSGTMGAILKKNAAELAKIHGNLLSATEGKEINSLLITSCHAGEGKTVSAISIAYSISKLARLRVLLIDGNASSPALHTLFGLHASPGLTDIVFGSASAGDSIKETGFFNISLLPYGSRVDSSLALYRSPNFASTIESVRTNFDLIVFDGPSLLVSSDASFASRLFDGVVLVIACEDTKWEVAQHVKEKIDSVGGNIVGTILNRRKYYIPFMFY